jgi:hypothetical protein
MVCGPDDFVEVSLGVPRRDLPHLGVAGFRRCVDEAEAHHAVGVLDHLR